VARMRIALCSVGLLAGLLAGSTLGMAAARGVDVTFHVQYFAEGGSYQTDLVAKEGAGVAGEAWLDSDEHDHGLVRTLTVCDRHRDANMVRARIIVPDGRRIDYPAPVGPRCYVRRLTYPISRWQLLVGTRFSGAVPPPRLV
jgi:hypothetical protein